MFYKYSEGFAKVVYKNGFLSNTVAPRVSPEEAYDYQPIDKDGSLRVIYLFIPGCVDPIMVDHNNQFYARVNGEYVPFSRMVSPKLAA